MSDGDRGQYLMFKIELNWEKRQFWLQYFDSKYFLRGHSRSMKSNFSIIAGNLILNFA